MNDLERQAWTRAAGELRTVSSSRERSIIVKGLADRFGVTVKTAYERFGKVGYDFGRAARKDKGRSILALSDLEQASSIVAAGLNKRGQPNTPVSEARLIGQDVGLPFSQVSEGHLRRLLAREGLGPTQMRAPEAAVAQRSLHPNHVWFFDISVAIQWYFRDERGKRVDLFPDAGQRFYAGKFENYRALKRVIHRFLITDHYSGAYFAQYFYTPGERWEDVIAFLWSAMAAKEEYAEAFPLRGRPEWLIMDQGPANKSAFVQSLLEGLDIKVHLHGAGNAKMSGSVESRHNHWQRRFEGRLGIDHGARDLEELNHLARLQCAHDNARRPHSRTGKAPIDVWMKIRPEQLREVPRRGVFFQLAASAPMERTLDNYLRISVDNKEFQVTGTNVHPKQKVNVKVAPYAPAGLRVWDQWGRELAVTELTFDEAHQATNGLHHTFGADEGATMPQTPGQRVAERVREDRASVDVGDVWAAMEARVEATTFLSPRGTEWAPPTDAPLAAEPLLSDLDCRLEAIARLERPLTPEEGAWWAEAAKDGLTTSAFEARLAAFARGDLGADADTDTDTDTGATRATTA